MKQNAGDHNFTDDSQNETVVKRWLITEDTRFYQQAIKQLFPRHNRCIDCGGDCVKGQWEKKVVQLYLNRAESKEHKRLAVNTFSNSASNDIYM